jgi:serine/threonine-protein kinase HipA
MMDELTVAIDFGAGAQPVGNLLRQGNKFFFQYADTYLRTGHNLSPLKLRFDASVQQAETSIFDGLFGVFADSLPDGWGRLLLDRELQRRGVDLDTIGPLRRLAYVGTNGRGALAYRPALPVQEEKMPNLLLDELARRAADVLQDRDLDAVPELLRLGGSSGGARPKIQVLYNADTNDFLPDTFPAPPGYSAWIIKFNAANDPTDAAAAEYAYYLAAREAGISMAESRLFRGRSGRTYFGTRRFDRPSEDRRLHLHSLAGLLHDNFRLPALDYGHVMDAAFRLEQSTEAYRKVLRLAAFNVFAHNRDDHSNNISFLMDRQGEWSLAPAYDLTFSRPGHGEHSLTVAGEGRRPGRRQLLELATDFEVKGAAALLEEAFAAVSQLPKTMRDLGVAQPQIEELKRHLSMHE